MADLVKRLRTRGEATRAMGWTDLEDEAADAIEELTAALRECANRYASSAELLEKSIRPNSAMFMRGAAETLRSLLSKYEASNG